MKASGKKPNFGAKSSIFDDFWQIGLHLLSIHGSWELKIGTVRDPYSILD